MKKLFLTSGAFCLFILSCSQVSVDSRTDSITSFIESYLETEGERPVNSILVYYEDPAGHQKIAHSFQGPEDITAVGNTSFDWSGGGLISTTQDLNTFINALMNNKLFKKQETLSRMMDICKTAWGFEYGLGLIAFTMNDTKYYGHSGFWGVVMVHQPELKQTLTLCFSQAAAPFNYVEFSAKIIQIANME